MNLETESIVVRQLESGDLDAMTALDAKITGRRREQYLKSKVEQALHDTGVQLSLAAVVDGGLAGFALARVYYGEYGAAEPVAVLDTLGVHPDFRGRSVGRALLRQLRTNLHGLGVASLQTKVDLADPDLAFFFYHMGFQPAPRMCLDLDLEQARIADETAEAEGVL